MSEDVKEIIEKIEYYDGKFPEEELQFLIDNKEKSNPFLLDCLSDAEECLNKLWEDGDYILPFYAVFLLAQFREKKAYPLIYEIFASDPEKVDIWGDFVAGDLGSILASVCDGDVSLINKLIEDEDVYEYVRSSAANAWVCLLKAEVKSYDEVVAYYKDILQRKWEDGDSIYTWVVNNCLDIRAHELMPEFERLFADNQIDPMMFGDWEAFQKELKSDYESLYYKNNQQYDLVTDMISDLKTWVYFREEKEKNELPSVSSSNLNQSSFLEPVSFEKEEPLWDSRYQGTFVRETPKLGKNDPCFCGSGIKYKKCCMN